MMIINVVDVGTDEQDNQYYLQEHYFMHHKYQTMSNGTQKKQQIKQRITLNKSQL